MSKRIVFCVARGRRRFGEMALGLARSLSLIQDTTRRVIMTDIEGVDWKRHFDEVIPPPGPRSALDKLTALEVTDADQVLSLDVDMLAFKRLDPIFDFCAGKPFVLQGFWTDSGNFHGRPVQEILKEYGVERMPWFNGGLAYYERSPVYERLLHGMREAEAAYDDLRFNAFRGGKSEEVCMLDAMLRQDYAELAPMELQFQHSAAGLIGKLHLDVLKNECKAVALQRKPELVDPYVFHAWRYKDFLIYWRQLDKLRKLDEYADRHHTMYQSRMTRYLRSIHRRIIRMKVGK